MRRSVAVLLLLCVLPAPAEGDEKADKAAQAFARGKQLFEDKLYVSAAEAFEEAYRLRPHFLVQCSIARCYENLNKYVTAAERYRQCLREGAAGSKMGEKIKASLEGVEAQITHVTVSSARAGDSIFVDGREVGVTPRKVALNPGSHVVEVRREGARPARRTLKTLGGDTLTVELNPVDLAPPGPAVAPEPVTQPPPKLVTTDGMSRRSLSQLWFWSAVGVTAGLAATAIAFGAATLSSRSDYEDAPTKPKLDDFKSKRTTTNVLWGLTAAAAAGSTVLFFYTDFGGGSGKGERAASSYGIGVRGSF